MENEIIDYLRIMQLIAISKGGDMFAPTLPGYNMRRMQAHEALFAKLRKTLTLKEGFSENDCFFRSKEIFSRLDAVFRCYNGYELDLTQAGHIFLLTENLQKFLAGKEAKNYLEGRTDCIQGVVEEYYFNQ